jgi:hypothetical protein
MAEQKLQKILTDGQRIADLAKADPDQDSVPIRVFNTQFKMVLRDWLLSASAEEVETLKNSTVDQLWESTLKP